MKKILFSCFFILFISNAFATHLIGGEMRYEYIGPGSAPNSKQYRIRLLLLRGPGGATFIPQYIVGVFNNDNGLKVPGTADNNNWAAVEDFVIPLPVPIIISPCIQLPPVLNYTYKTYSFVIELPDNASGYTVAFQTFSRQNSNNIFDNQGATYSCVIPGLGILANPATDNSPQFSLPVSVICENSPFTLDFSAVDPDAGDSLVYTFCNAYNGGLAGLADFRDPAPPPYMPVSYINPFNSASPLGSLVTINPNTGIISGTAPIAGKYVICVCAAVFRNGVLISVHRKDLIVEVSGCIPLTANPDFVPITCDGFNVNFVDASSGNPDTYFWDFGDPASGAANTSNLPNPSHNFTDTGVFNIKLVVSIAGQCVDSIIKPLKVYPGFLPGFLNSAPLCIGLPVQFLDTTYSRYGLVDSWRWDFGDGATLADTSHLQNPFYTYNLPGTYNVQLIVTNDKGCLKTYNKDVVINGLPPLDLFPADTTYCGLDSLQLTATGTGSFSWSPVTNIMGGNTATPLVFPNVPTRYVVTLTDANGCKSRDSLTVTPKLDLINAIVANPPTICEEDTLILSGSSNYSPNVSWQWSPVATLGSPGLQSTQAWPLVNTTYTLTTRWGTHCVATANQNIIVRPLAIPNAGADAFVCNVVPTSTQLNASGGTTYQWTPVTGLSNPNIANPVASPTAPTFYVVAVGVAGCPKLRTDTVFVDFSTAPLISTLNDTLICNIDTLQLTTSGTGTFNWTPNYMISNTTIASPMVSPDVPTWYYVTLANAVGCQSKDSVFVDVKNVVSLNAGADTTVCQADGFFLNVTSDALRYKWTPSTYLNYDTLKRPFAKPLATITYTLVGNIGKCQSQDNVTITVVPYPLANAGPDTAICTGFSTQLNASGGSSYAWSPVSFLSNGLIPNPMCSSPPGNIQYIVTIRDTLGCPKPVKDTIWVRVHQRIRADAGPRDTSVVNGEPLFLHATGAHSYVWSPSTWLNNPGVANPVSLPQNNIQYILTATSLAGCKGTDTIDIKLYKIDPDMYVPTAFTPNDDGNNDVLRPILIGMKNLNFFRVYNRWGVLMFSTTEKGKGWNGRHGGKAQDPATFVWMAEGVTYKNQLRKKKGYAVLIR